jgi:hypothetical protein
MEVKKFIDEQLFATPEFEFEDWETLDGGMDEEYDHKQHMLYIFDFLKDIYAKEKLDPSIEENFSFSQVHQVRHRPLKFH